MQHTAATLNVRERKKKKQMMIHIGGFQPQQNPMIEICVQHPECKDCPAIGGQPLIFDQGQTQMICESGRDKKPTSTDK